MVGNLGSREGETSKLKGFDYNVYRKSLLTDEMEKCLGRTSFCDFAVITPPNLISVVQFNFKR